MLQPALLLGIMLMFVLPGYAQSQPPVLEIGKPFPVISLPAMRDGEAMSIADYRGKRVVLHIFASW